MVQSTIINTQSFHTKFAGATTIVADRKNAAKITSHFITKGRWFFVEEIGEGEAEFRYYEYAITFSENIDLDYLRRILKTVDFKIW